MKLIDLLVKELPGRGGWPKGMKYLAQDSSGVSIGKVYGYEIEPANRGYYWLNDDEKDDSGYGVLVMALKETATDCREAFVTSEQYQQAIATKKVSHITLK